MTDQGLTMPDDTRLEDGSPDSVSAAIVKHVDDDIDDARTLREWRKRYAIYVSIIGIICYGILLFAMWQLFKHPTFVAAAPTVALGILLILAAIPILILVSLSKAIFGKHSSGNTYTPLQTLIHLIKEMKEG